MINKLLLLLLFSITTATIIFVANSDRMEEFIREK